MENKQKGDYCRSLYSLEDEVYHKACGGVECCEPRPAWFAGRMENMCNQKAELIGSKQAKSTLILRDIQEAGNKPQQKIWKMLDTLKECTCQSTKESESVMTGKRRTR